MRNITSTTDAELYEIFVQDEIYFTLYRGGPDSVMPENKSALDILEYERNDLGNFLNIYAKDSKLKKIPAKECAWVCLDKEHAKQYGRVHKLLVKDFEYLAGDFYGGYLVRIFN